MAPRKISLKGQYVPARPGPTPVQQQARVNAQRARTFETNSAQRVQAAAASPGSHAQRAEAVKKAQAREETYRAQHEAAQAERIAAAAAVQKVASKNGGQAEWKGISDSRTSRECATAQGHNIIAGDPPAIGLPGAAHPNCRCHPAKPSPDAGLIR